MSIIYGPKWLILKHGKRTDQIFNEGWSRNLNYHIIFFALGTIPIFTSPRMLSHPNIRAKAPFSTTEGVRSTISDNIWLPALKTHVPASRTQRKGVLHRALSMLHFYIITTVALLEKGICKFGYHKGTFETLRKRYITSLPEQVIYLFIEDVHAHIIEYVMKKKFDKARILGDEERPSEWIQCDMEALSAAVKNLAALLKEPLNQFFEAKCSEVIVPRKKMSRKRKHLPSTAGPPAGIPERESQEPRLKVQALVQANEATQPHDSAGHFLAGSPSPRPSGFCDDTQRSEKPKVVDQETSLEVSESNSVEHILIADGQSNSSLTRCLWKQEELSWPSILDNQNEHPNNNQREKEIMELQDEELKHEYVSSIMRQAKKDTRLTPEFLKHYTDTIAECERDSNRFCMSLTKAAYLLKYKDKYDLKRLIVPELSRSQNPHPYVKGIDFTYVDERDSLNRAQQEMYMSIDTFKEVAATSSMMGRCVLEYLNLVERIHRSSMANDLKLQRTIK